MCHIIGKKTIAQRGRVGVGGCCPAGLTDGLLHVSELIIRRYLLDATLLQKPEDDSELITGHPETGQVVNNIEKHALKAHERGAKVIQEGPTILFG